MRTGAEGMACLSSPWGPLLLGGMSWGSPLLCQNDEMESPSVKDKLRKKPALRTEREESQRWDPDPNAGRAAQGW